LSGIRDKLESWLRRVVYSAPPLYLDPEKEDELIEKLATTLANANIGMPVRLFGPGFESMSTIISQTFLWQLAPFLELVGIKGYEYSALFNKKENVRRLIERVKELEQEKQERK
jgi:hypothetical protein